MPSPPKNRSRVGSVRPSHLMFTGGVGALIDLPNFTVLVRGIDEWNYDSVPDWEPLSEPRLLDAARRLLGPGVGQLRPAPWLDGVDTDPSGPAARVGVPVLPFPAWIRCTACNQLAELDSGLWDFENVKPRRPDEARFTHRDCPRRRTPLAVPARFLLACTAGHLDDFPYVGFVHKGGACPRVSHPTLVMRDAAGNLAANVTIECANCDARANIRQAMGKAGEKTLPGCRGRHPHLQTFEPTGCDALPKLLVLGASNQWFPQTLAALAVPPASGDALAAEVARLWESHLQYVTVPAVLDAYLNMSGAAFAALKRWAPEQILAAIQAHRMTLDGDAEEQPHHADLKAPEWRVFSATEPPSPRPDFALRRDPAGVPEGVRELFSDVVQVERLREVRALVGFTRLDAPDPDDADLVTRAPLSRDRTPAWVPASEVRGEGLFLRVPEELVSAWESRVADSAAVEAHVEAYVRFRHRRYSGRVPGDFDPRRGWPGMRYIALHTLSHLLIRAIAVECGYTAASLAERIYAGGDDQRAGLLIYTAVPDAEGTLGGLVSLGEPASFERIVRRALSDARRCSSDPLCAERLPHEPADFLHGAACHACLFVSETTCERGNKFLDRRFVVPIDDPTLALAPNLM